MHQNDSTTYTREYLKLNNICKMKIKSYNKYIEDKSYLKENVELETNTQPSWPTTKQGVYEMMKAKGANFDMIEINDDLTIDFKSNVWMSNVEMTHFNNKYGKISGSFTCANVGLTTLEWSPHTVTNGFNCATNKLTSLVGGPTFVSGNYLCSKNKLTNLIGAPTSKINIFSCRENLLTSLEGAPTEVSIFDCSNNPGLTSLEFCPKIINESIKLNGCINLTSLIGIPEDLDLWKFAGGHMADVEIAPNLFEYLDYRLEKNIGAFDLFYDWLEFEESIDNTIPKWFKDKYDWLFEIKKYNK